MRRNISDRLFLTARFLAAVTLLVAVPGAQAAVYWDNTGGTANDWQSVANWSTDIGGGIDPSAVPGAADVATFSATPIVTTAQTVNLNDAVSVLGLDFTSAVTADTTLLGGVANQTLTIGSSGITKAGTGAVTIGSATAGQQVAIFLDANQTWANSDNTSAITITNGVTSNAAGPRTLTLGGASTALNTISGIIGNGSGTVSLTKSDAGTWVLSGANTYTGTTTLSAGILRATTNASALGGAAAPLSLGGGELQLANNSALNFGRNTAVTGDTAITSDRLAAGAGVTHTLGTLSIGAQTLTINRGPLATSGTGGITFGATTLTGNATFSPQANTLLTVSTIALGTNTLNKSGAGSMTASGVVSGGPAAGSNAISITDGVFTAGSASSTFTGNIAVDGSGVFAMAGNTFTTAAPYGRAGNLYKQLLLTNGGTFRLTSGTFNNNNPSSTNTAAGIIFNIGSGGGTFDIASGAQLTIDDGTGTGTAAGSSQLQGSGTITKTGLGTFQQDDSTAFAGAIIIAAGTFQPATPNAGGAKSAGTTIQSGARYNVNGVTMTNQEPLTINGTGLASAPAGALTNASGTAATWVGPVTLGSAATIGSSAAGGLTLSSTATVDTAGNTLTIAISGSGRIFTDGVISGTGSLVINNTGTGDYVPRADHTYSGGTTLTAGLVAVDRNSIGTPGSPTSGPFGTGTLTIAGGQMRSGTGGDRTIGNAVVLSGDPTFYAATSEKNLIFTGPVTLSGGNRTLTANVGSTVASRSTVFSGAIGDGGSNLGLIKAGTGNLALGGINTYTGPTTVNGGLLSVTGSIGSTALTVAGGATLTLVSNAANAPTLATMNLGTAAATTTLGLDLGANTAGSDSLAASGAATTAGTVNLNLNAIAGFGSSPSYTLLSAASGLSGATYALVNIPGGYTPSLVATDTAVTLNVAPAAATGNLYWGGGVNNSWGGYSSGTTNWTTDAAGTVNAGYVPGAGNTVVFSGAGAVGPAIALTIDGNYTVNDLQFTAAPAAVTSVSIATKADRLITDTTTLTIAPAVATAGISLAQGAGEVTIGYPLTLDATQTWSVDSSTPGAGTASSLTVSGAIGGAAANGVTFTTTAGTTPIILAAAGSTYSGPTTISAGTELQGGATNGFSPNTAWTVDGTLNTGDFNQNTGSLVGGLGVVQNGSASNRTLTIGSDNLASATFAGTIQNGSTGTLGITKAGTGTQILSGTNTYTGTTTVAAGTLVNGSATTFGSAGIGNGALALSGTGVFDLNGFDAAVTNVSSSVVGSTITNNGASDATLAISAQANTISSLVSDGSTNKLAVTLRNGNTGTTPFLLSSANTFSGGLTLVDGSTLGAGTRLPIGAAITGTPFGTGPITIGQAATDKAGIYFSGADNTIGLPIVINTALGNDRYGIRNDGRTITLSGLITANTDAVFSSNNAAASNTIVTNKVTGAGGLAIDLSQTSAANTVHTVTLNTAANANDYAGDTIVGRTNATPAQNYAATLALGAADQIPNGLGKGDVILNNNSGTRTGTLNLNGFNETINGLFGNGTLDGGSGTPTLTVGDNNVTSTFSGIIQSTAGALTLTKIGSGTLTLSGTSSFAGPINVNGGLIAFPSSPSAYGPLGNSTAVNLDGGGLSYIAVGATTALNRNAAIGAGNGTFDVASSTSTLTVASLTSTGGSLVKTGPGILSLTGTTTLNGGAAGVVVNGGTLQAGFGAGGIASINVASTGAMSFQNSAIETLTLGSTGTVLTMGNGARLGFELDGTTNDSITVPTGGGLSLGGSYTFDFFNYNAGVAANTYTLLTAPAGSGLNAYTYNLGNAPLGFNYTFVTSDTMVQLLTSAYTPIYWTGLTDGSLVVAGNFASDAAGTTPAGHAPLATETLIFNASNAAVFTANLDGSRTIDSLQFNGVPFPSLVTLQQGTGGTLTLKPASASGGVAILAGGGNATIAAPLALDNTLSASQTWSVADAWSTLTISGNVTFGANVNKAGAGVIVLSGSNTGSGNFNLNAGALHLNSSGALGTGALSIAAGTTLDNSSFAPVTLTGNGPVNINGDFTFAGSNNLSLGTAAVTLNANPTITIPASTLTFGGVVGGGSGLTKAGSGTLVLGGNNTYAGTTNVDAGALNLLGNNATTGSIVLGGGTLNLGHAGALGNGTLVANSGTIDNITGAALVNANNNPITLNGVLTFTGTDDLNLGTGAVTLAAQSTITAGAKNLTLGGDIGGSFGLTKAGPGTLTLAGANTFGGPTGITDGTLVLAGANTFVGQVGITGGTVVLANAAALGPVGQAVRLDNATLDFALDAPGNAYAITSGSGTTSTVRVNRATSGVGITHTVQSAALGNATWNVEAGPNVASGDAILEIGSINLSAGAAGTLTLNANTAKISITGPVNIGSNSHAKTLALGGTNTGNEVSGVISNGLNTLSVTKTGTGTWTLLAANTYTGATTVSQGTLILPTARTATAGSISVGNVAGNTATLKIQADLPMGGNQIGVGAAADVIATIDHTAGTVSFTSANALLIGQAGANGSGTYNLDGGTINTYSSTTRGVMIGVNGGSSGSPMSGTFNLISGTLNNATGTLLVVRSDSASSYLNATYNQTGGTSTNGTLIVGGNVANGADSTATVSITGGVFSAAAFSYLSAGNNVNSTITIGGTADVTLPAFPTARGTTSTATLYFDGGTLRPTAASATYISNLTNAFIQDGGAKFDVPAGRDITVNQALLEDSGSTGGALTKVGPGVLSLSGANTYTGGTAVNEGVLTYLNTGAKPATGTTAVAGGATLALGVATAGSFFTATDVDNLFANTLTGVTLAPTSNVGVDTTQGNFEYASNVPASSPYGLSKTGSNTLSLTGTNAYSGPTTIYAGVLQVGNGGTVGTLGPNAIVNYATLAFNRSDTYTLAATNLVTGTGSVTLANGAVATAVDNQFAVSGNLIFGAAPGATTTASLDLTNGSSAFGGLVVQTNSATANLLTVGVGKTLTINGGMSVGVSPAADGQTTKFTATGDGALVVGGATAVIDIGMPNTDQNNTGNSTTVDFTGLGSFSANVDNFRIGWDSRNGATLLGSNTANSITANFLRVGHSNGDNAGSPIGLTLGTGSNLINASTIQIGLSKATASIAFASQTAGSPGTLTLRGTAGGASTADITLGSNNGTSTAGTATGTLDLRGHVVDVLAGAVTLGIANQTGAGGGTGRIFFDAGTFAVDTLNLGTKTNTGAGVATGLIEVGGGNFTVNSGGSFTLGSQATAGSSVATLNLTGGTFTSNVDIVAGAGATNSTITLNGGTLDMTGKNIGGATVVDNLNLQSGTLKNVAEINGGAAIAKTTTGTLVLDGVNTYTGTTAVNAGTLLATNPAALPGYNASKVTPVVAAATLAVRAGEWTNADVDAVLGATGAGFAAGSNFGLEVVGANSFTYANDVGVTEAGKGFVKLGSGSATLTAAQTYTGDTRVEAGTLEVTLGINNGGTAVADTIVGTSGPSPTTAELITGHVRQDTLTINDGSQVQITGTSTSVVNFLQIANGSGGFTWDAGSGGATPAGTTGGGGVNAVPEPATWLLAVIAALAGLVAWRRRR